jgi:hypothetical protein
MIFRLIDKYFTIKNAGAILTGEVIASVERLQVFLNIALDFGFDLNFISVSFIT